MTEGDHEGRYFHARHLKADGCDFALPQRIKTFHAAPGLFHTPNFLPGCRFLYWYRMSELKRLPHGSHVDAHRPTIGKRSERFCVLTFSVLLSTCIEKRGRRDAIFETERSVSVLRHTDIKQENLRVGETVKIFGAPSLRVAQRFMMGNILRTNGEELALYAGRVSGLISCALGHGNTGG